MSLPDLSLGGAAPKVVVGEATARALSTKTLPSGTAGASLSSGCPFGSNASATSGSEVPNLEAARKARREVQLRRRAAEGFRAAANLASNSLSPEESSLLLSLPGGENPTANADMGDADVQKRLEMAAEALERPLPARTMNYHEYLRLDEMLSLQVLESEGKRPGGPAHDEMLFIIVHQAFELWFKQIDHELRAVTAILDVPRVPESHIGRAVHLLTRIIEILKLMGQQFNVLETMTPIDFMEFRDYLVPASGFQSFQFRMFENRLGLAANRRVLHHGQPYWRNLSPLHQALAVAAESEPSLFSAVSKWLERTPFLDEFLKDYQQAVHRMFEEDAATVRANTQDPDILADELKRVELNRAEFDALFDASAHEKLVQQHKRRLPLRATQAALLIQVYHEEGLMQMPSELLRCLVEIDEQIVGFRQKHAMMVTRMIGTKIGTGASSGYNYLKSTVERGRVFSDLANLATYVIPRARMPTIPPALRKQLQTHWEVVTHSHTNADAVALAQGLPPTEDEDPLRGRPLHAQSAPQTVEAVPTAAVSASAVPASSVAPPQLAISATGITLPWWAIAAAAAVGVAAFMVPRLTRQSQ